MASEGSKAKTRNPRRDCKICIGSIVCCEHAEQDLSKYVSGCNYTDDQPKAVVHFPGCKHDRGAAKP